MCASIRIIPNPVITVEAVVASYLPAKKTLFSSNFSYGDAPHSVGKLLTGECLFAVIVDVQIAFNGGGNLSIGVSSNHELFMKTAQVLPQETGIYQVNPLFKALVPTDIFIYLSPNGETQGNGLIYLLIG